jgi:hypothetical protein
MLGCIPHLEAWYPEPISTNAIRWSYLIPKECDWDEIMPVRFDRNVVLPPPWRPDMTDDEIEQFLEVRLPDIESLPRDTQERRHQLLENCDKSNKRQVMRTAAQPIADWK